MNKPSSNELIDEAELRAALQPWRTDTGLFTTRVRLRIEQADVRSRLVDNGDTTKLERSDWLQAAAAVIPVPLLSHGASGGLVKLGQLSLGKKLVAFAALPATGLLLMLAASIWAVIKIRKAQRGQSLGGMDAAKLAQVTADWWRQFGLVTPIMCVVMLCLMLTGHPLPVFIIFLLSGMAMVALISRLGKAGLVDRRTVAGALTPGLMILVQLTHTTTMFSFGYPFLDQMLIPTVLLLGGLAITIVCFWPGAPTGSSPSMLMMCLPLVLLAGWFGSSMWNPVTKQDLKTYVESFSYAKFSSASWQQWQAVADWLHESDVSVDLSKPRALLRAELAQAKPNPWILCHAIESDLFELSDLDQVQDLAAMKKRVFDSFNQGRPFISVGYEPRILIRALVMRGELSADERDFLAERLLATLEGLKTKNFGRLLEEQQVITELSALIDRPINIDAFRDFVHQTLVSHQCLGFRLGGKTGGFTMSEKLNHSDQYATLAAIELMQVYGVPPRGSYRRAAILSSPLSP